MSLFGKTTGFNAPVEALSLQSDGKVLVGGQFTSYDGTSRPCLARLNTDGSLDTGFAPTGGGLNNYVYDLSLQSDGKVLAGGAFTTYNGTARRYVARINSDGSLDTSFAPAGSGLGWQARALSLQSDGRLLVGGWFTSYNGTARPYAARLNSDGSLDTSFAPTGSGFDGYAYAFSLQSDGRVLVGGQFASYNGTATPNIARLNTDGSLDTSFATTGSGLNNAVRALSLQSDGRLQVGGNFTSYNGAARPYVARLNAEGSLDANFGSAESGFNNPVSDLSIQSDGKVMAAGQFTSYNGTARPRVARLNADGSLDSSFAATGSGLNNPVNVLSLQSDGKVLVGGSFASYNGTSTPYVARLNTDGSLDASFATTGSGFNSFVLAISPQMDGRVLAGGSFASYNGTPRPYVARLLTDGSLDPTFAPTGSGLNSTVNALSLQSDAKVIVGGSLTSYNGTSRPRVARLNADGSLDTSFAPTGTGLNSDVFDIALQSDGKILVAGSFTSYNGTSRPYVARLNADGSLDPTFAPTGSGLSATVVTLSLQSDGKVLVGGLFSSYHGTARSRVARLNTDGSLDTSFAPTGSGLSDSVQAVFLQSDGKVLVGGLFTTYGPSTANYLARLTYIGTLD